MRYRMLTADGDYSFGQGAANFFVDSSAAVAQSVLTRLKLWLGEWFLDETEGMPWDPSVLGKDTKALYDQAIQTRILETEGVVRLEDYSSDFNSQARTLTVQMTVTTIFSPEPIVIRETL